MQVTLTALAVAASAPVVTKARVQVQLDEGKWFEAQYPDVFEKYCLPPVSSDKLVQAWGSSPMEVWQNQLNFAIWCATTGCGVSLEDHLTAADPTLRSSTYTTRYWRSSASPT